MRKTWGQHPVLLMSVFPTTAASERSFEARGVRPLLRAVGLTEVGCSLMRGGMYSLVRVLPGDSTVCGERTTFVFQLGDRVASLESRRRVQAFVDTLVSWATLDLIYGR